MNNTFTASIASAAITAFLGVTLNSSDIRHDLNDESKDFAKYGKVTKQQYCQEIEKISGELNLAFADKAKDGAENPKFLISAKQCLETATHALPNYVVSP